MTEQKEKLSVLGKPVPLVDAYEKVTGQFKFAGDLSVLGMLHAKVLRSPYPHAKILEVDTIKAEGLPGVRAVITHKNIPDKEWHNIWWSREGKIMDSVVRYVGDEVAAVAAEDEATAETAIGLVEVKYEQLPAVFDIEEAMKPTAPEVRAGGNASQRTASSWGHVDKGFKKSDIVVERRSTMGYQQHCPLGRNACIASWTGDKLTMWTGTQTMFNLRDGLAGYFEIPQNHVRVIQLPLGCSQGLWWEMNFHYITALLARQAGRPVRLELTREEVTTTTKRREHPVSYVKFGMTKEGKLTTGYYRHYFDNGAYGFKPDPFQCSTDIYPCDNGDFEAVGINTNLMTAGCMRGVGDLTLQYAVEQVIDMAAEKINMNPVEFRMKNHFRTGDILHCTPEALFCSVMSPEKPTPVFKLSTEGLDQCLQRGAELIGWKEKWQGWGKPVAIEGMKRRGIGVAISSHVTGIPMLGATGAVVRVNTDGTACLTLGPGRMGQGASTTQCQVVAEVLGIHAEDVAFTEPDTLHTPEAPSTVGSVTAYRASPVTKAAAEDAKRKILDIAAKHFNVKPEELDIKDRRIFVKANPEEGIGLGECLSKVQYEILSTPVIVGSASFGFRFLSVDTARITMAGFAEVEVDTETGIVKVVDYAQVHDSGTIMNPAVIYNQASGGVYTSAGAALGEDLIFDEDGKILNPNFMDYKVVGILDFPDPKIDFVVLYEPSGVFGIKGIGEGSTCVAAIALAMAVYNAIGVRVDPPLTPERILNALKEKGG